jgi:4'-phosphopantetheinyl transferase
VTGVRGAWIVPVATPLLGPEDVHVWRVRLDVPHPAVARFAASLPQDERADGERLAFDHLRRRFLVRRGALRRIIGAYLVMPPEDVHLERGERRKPRLGGAHVRSGIRFNATHSEELALVAVARDRELGVDLEHIRPLPAADAIAERWFASAECRRLRRLPEPDRLFAFYEYWTQKEGLAKACGHGLTNALNARADAMWMSAQLRPGRSYLGSVVVEGGRCNLATYAFEAPTAA